MVVIDLQGIHPKTRASIQGRVLPMLLTVGRSRVLVSMLVVAVIDDTVTQVMQVVVFNTERYEF